MLLVKKRHGIEVNVKRRFVFKFTSNCVRQFYCAKRSFRPRPLNQRCSYFVREIIDFCDW